MTVDRCDGSVMTLRRLHVEAVSTNRQRSDDGVQGAFAQPEVVPSSAADARQDAGTVMLISIALVGAGPQSHNAI